MKKQLKTKLSLNKETVARLNDEQIALITGGQAAAPDVTVTATIIQDMVTGDKGNECGVKTLSGTNTCPITSSCLCVCE